MWTEYVLWGRHPSYADGQLIKLCGGAYREVCRELSRRKGEGWKSLAIKQTPHWDGDESRAETVGR